MRRDLNVIFERKRISIEKVDNYNYVRRVIKLGDRLLLYICDSGKILLDYLSEIKRLRYFCSKKDEFL